MFYAVDDSRKLGLIFAHFDSVTSTNTIHLYDTREGTLCGEFKGDDPLSIWLPNHYENICLKCTHILKSRINNKKEVIIYAQI